MSDEPTKRPVALEQGAAFIKQEKVLTPQEIQMSKLAKIEAEAYVEPDKETKQPAPPPPAPVKKPEVARRPAPAHVPPPAPLREAPEIKKIIKTSKRKRSYGTLFSIFKKWQNPQSPSPVPPQRDDDRQADAPSNAPSRDFWQPPAKSITPPSPTPRPVIDMVKKPTAHPVSSAALHAPSPVLRPVSTKKQMDIMAPSLKTTNPPEKRPIPLSPTPPPTPPPPPAPSPPRPTVERTEVLPKTSKIGPSPSVKERSHGLHFTKMKRIALKPLEHSYTPKPNIPVSPTGRADIPARPNLTLQFENANLRNAAMLVQEDTGSIAPPDTTTNEDQL